MCGFRNFLIAACFVPAALQAEPLQAVAHYARAALDRGLDRAVELAARLADRQRNREYSE